MADRANTIIISDSEMRPPSAAAAAAAAEVSAVEPQT
jgi:hypothetical protein